MLGQLVVSGIAIGCCYAMIALAMVIVYKASEVLNFAQGELAMVSTFVAYSLMLSLGLPFPLAAASALLFAFALGAVCEFAFLRQADEPTLLGLIVITLGMEMMLYGAAGWIWGADTKSFPSPISDTSVYEISGIIISDQDLTYLATALLLAGLLFLFFRYTRVGVAMRATSQNESAAKLMGIRTQWINTFTWGLSSVIGALAGILMAPRTMLDPNMMMDPLLKGFAAAVLGGMTSLPGAALGGCLLGVIENLVAGYISTEFKSVVAFVVIVIVLCVRPAGLLGQEEIKKV